MNFSGVYIITNLINNKVYIGSSINIEKRFNQHIAKLRINKHSNLHLQRSWNEYGESFFEFELLEKVEISSNKKISRDTLKIYEEKYIQRYFGDSCYNISKTAYGGYTGIDCSGENNWKHKKVSVFDLNMNFIEEVSGLRACIKKYKGCSVRACCVDGQRKSGLYIFRYSDNINIEIKPQKRPKNIFKEIIYLYNTESGSTLEFTSMFQLSKSMGLNRGTIKRKIDTNSELGKYIITRKKNKS